MEYQLETYRPGACDSDGCIKTFAAPVSFYSIRLGDLLNTRTWERPVEWPLLRVVNVEPPGSKTDAGYCYHLR